MRVNVYAEEMTDKVEIITKHIEGQDFTGLRFYLELPVTVQKDAQGDPVNVQGPFIHRAFDDDSAAVTFWGKRDLRGVLRQALTLLDAHYERRAAGRAGMPAPQPDRPADGNRVMAAGVVRNDEKGMTTRGGLRDPRD